MNEHTYQPIQQHQHNFGEPMSTNKKTTNNTIKSNQEDLTMSTDKTTPTTLPPTGDINNNSTTGEPMKKTDTASEKPHHTYYVFGTAEEEWIPGSYRQPWIWHSPDDLPISPNFHGYWEKLPSKECISEAGLSYFKEHAIPIDKEEYDRLIEIKKNRQHADDRAEYMWYGPRYDDED